MPESYKKLKAQKDAMLAEEKRKSNAPAIMELSEMVEQADNFLAWLDNPFASDDSKLDAVTRGLRIARRRMKDIYLKLGGADWEIEA